ncbi:MAG: hypothetical protein A2V86_09185 [Deltaproteobacteria bacterium RBG_16_49_23]|nr:MAG: hypothetical protein A2V86_09185 [Deltaproteobacteria bacterium RBG_16_49_23]
MPRQAGRYGSWGHEGLGSALSADEDVVAKPDGQTGGDERVGGLGQVICIYPNVTLAFLKEHSDRYPIPLSQSRRPTLPLEGGGITRSA